MLLTFCSDGIDAMRHWISSGHGHILLVMVSQLKISSQFAKANHVTLKTGDSLKLMKALPTDSVSLVITSPPYNIRKPYESEKQTIDQYVDGQRAVIQECLRVLKPGGSLCWQVGQHVNGHNQIIPIDMLLHETFWSFNKTHDLRLRNRIVWNFEHGLHCRRRFSGRHETILWYTLGDAYEFDLDQLRVPQIYPGKRAYRGPNKGQLSGNPLGKNPGDVWRFPNVKGNHIEKTLHPCQFPVELPERFIVALTAEQDLVLDPYAGVGTTAVASVLNQRRSIGFDLSSEYIRIARKRVREAFDGSLRYRAREKPVYEPAPDGRLTRTPPGFAKWGNSSVTATTEPE